MSLDGWLRKREAIAPTPANLSDGTYTGRVSVSISRLEEHHSVELTVAAFNATGYPLRVASAHGTIILSRPNIACEHALRPVDILRDRTNIENIAPFAEFTVVLEQTLRREEVATLTAGLETDGVQLQLRSLDILMETISGPTRQGRLTNMGRSIARPQGPSSGRAYFMVLESAAVTVNASVG